MHVVVETRPFMRQAERIGLDNESRGRLASDLARSPKAGTPLGHGLYKIRVARKGGGKSGGYRVIYYYKEADLPLFLLFCFAKNVAEALTTAQEKELQVLAKRLPSTYRKSR